MKEWVVGKKQEGMRVMDFLLLHIETTSNKALKRQIEDGSLRINGVLERFASRKLRDKERITFTEQPRKAVAHFDPKDILYEDEALLLYNKPSGISCDPKGVLAHLSSYNNRLKLVHRLDKDTSGVLVLAKTDPALKAMETLFKERLVEKEYHAIVKGIVPFQTKIISNRLGKVSEFSGQTLYGTCGTSGLEAVTRFSLIKKGKSNSLVACFPETGRTHQIRVHLAELGFPILGDKLYGKEVGRSWMPSRLLLHSHRIQFAHPLKKDMLEVLAPTPLAFEEALKRL
ncbi:MAG: RluA family pseudouridine synthase [Parachlamydiaceae bacterium]